MSNTYRVDADTANIAADPSGNGNTVIPMKLIRLSDSVVVTTQNVPSAAWDVLTAQYFASQMIKTQLAKDVILATQQPTITNIKAYLTANGATLATG